VRLSCGGMRWSRRRPLLESSQIQADSHEACLASGYYGVFAEEALTVNQLEYRDCNDSGLEYIENILCG